MQTALQTLMNPLSVAALQWRVSALYWRRYRPNIRKLRAAWARIAREAYTRPWEEDSPAFWACVRRAYPDALTDTLHWRRAMSNISLMYVAGTETTSNAIGMILAALAVDRGSRARLEAVRTYTAAG